MIHSGVQKYKLQKLVTKLKIDNLLLKKIKMRLILSQPQQTADISIASVNLLMHLKFIDLAERQRERTMLVTGLARGWQGAKYSSLCLLSPEHFSMAPDQKNRHSAVGKTCARHFCVGCRYPQQWLSFLHCHAHPKLLDYISLISTILMESLHVYFQ